MAFALRRPLLRAPRDPWRKPTGIPQIDWEHPNTNGLILHWFDCGNGLMVDLVNPNCQFVPGGTKGPDIANRWGTFTNLSSASFTLTDTQIPKIPRDNFLKSPAGTSFTIMTPIIWNGVGGSGNYCGWLYDAGAGGVGGPFNIRPNQGLQWGVLNWVVGGGGTGPQVQNDAAWNANQFTQLFPYMTILFEWHDTTGPVWGYSTWNFINTDQGFIGPAVWTSSQSSSTDVINITRSTAADYMYIGTTANCFSELLLWDHAKKSLQEHAEIVFDLYGHLMPSQQQMPIFNAPPAPDLSLVRLVGHTQIEY